MYKNLIRLVLMMVLAIMPTLALAQVNTSGPNTPLWALWPLVPATLNTQNNMPAIGSGLFWVQPTNGQFNIGDFVCLDTQNSSAASGGLTYLTTQSIVYVFDNGTVRCPPGQPQVGIVAQPDPVMASTHKVFLQNDLDRTVLLSSLGGKPTPAFFLQPCNAISIAIANTNNQCFQ